MTSRLDNIKAEFNKLSAVDMLKVITYVEDEVEKEKRKAEIALRIKVLATPLELEPQLDAEDAEMAKILRKYGEKTFNETFPPKYRNPNGNETWSGHGHAPEWMVALLVKNVDLRDILINQVLISD